MRLQRDLQATERQAVGQFHHNDTGTGTSTCATTSFEWKVIAAA